MKAGDQIRIGNRTATLVRTYCRVGDVESWDAHFDGDPLTRDHLRTISVPVDRFGRARDYAGHVDLPDALCPPVR